MKVLGQVEMVKIKINLFLFFLRLSFGICTLVDSMFLKVSFA